MQTIEFNLNGRNKVTPANPERSLLSVLREDFGLTGTKQGCGKGQCGSCAVIVDGKVLMSCRIPVRSVAGKAVTSIEGIGSPDHPHQIQQAFALSGAVQCGFCTPGMVIRAKALLEKNPDPSREEIIRAFQPHLCRCTGYEKIIAAVRISAQALRGEVDLPSLQPDPGSHPVGHSIPRRDSLAKAAGTERYAADLQPDNPVYLKVLRSPHPHARIIKIDTGRAAAAPGVSAVFTAADVPGTNRLKISLADQPLLCDDKVRFIGDPVALVAAESEQAATCALALIKVDYELLPAVFDPLDALRAGTPQIHAGRPNLLADLKIERGDPAAGFAASSVVIEQTFSTPYIEHAYLEPDAGIAYLDEQERLVIAAGSQNIHHDRKSLADALGISADRLRVVQTPTGGAFGGKLDISVQGFLGLAVLRLGRPAKLVYSREETHLSTSKRHPFHIKCKLGADRYGKLTALEMDIVANTGAYATFGKSVMNRALIHATGPYRIPHVRLRGRVVHTNGPVSGAMRGYGVPQTTFAIESLLDMAAAKLGLDPLQVRALNGYRQGNLTATGQVLNHEIGLQTCLEGLRPAYEEAKKWAAQDSGEFKRGVGLAAMWFGPGKSQPDESEARIELLPDGHVRLRIGAADMGQGSDTVLAQIAAEELGIPFAAVDIHSTDTSTTPDGGYTSGSRQTYISGGAVREAAVALKAALLDAAARHWNLAAEELEYANGLVFGSSRDRQPLSLADLARQGLVRGRFCGRRTGQITNLDPSTGQGIPYETFTFGVQMAEVEVNTYTGETKVRRVLAIHDSGTPINPMQVEGQIEGGIVMGLGYALSEEFVPGSSEDFTRYRIPRFRDAPEVVTALIDIPRPGGPFGAAAIGECGLVATAPAITNAIAQACGARISNLPATKNKIRAQFLKP